MAESKVYRADAVATALAEIGYEAYSGKKTKYGAALDAVKWYNYPKNDGSVDWCCIFVDYCTFINTKPEDVNFSRSVMYEPNKDNCGAACKFKVDYFKAHGAWYEHKAKGCPAQIGDEVFFKKSNGVIYHTGIVVDWDSKGIYVVEGNTNGGKVAKKYYSYGDSKLAGYGRPNWTALEAPKEEKPVDDPKPDPVEPAPAPAPVTPSAPSAKIYRVIAQRGLNVRKGAGKRYDILYALNYGAKVTVYETKNGWGRIGDGKWVCMDYLK